MNELQSKPFVGEPKLYRKITVLGPVVMNAYLYLGMVGVVYGVHGKTWIFSWQPILAAVLFTAVMARISFPWMMNLDARYGTGSGWQLPSRKIKLPERRVSRIDKAQNEGDES